MLFKKISCDDWLRGSTQKMLAALIVHVIIYDKLLASKTLDRGDDRLFQDLMLSFLWL